MHIPIKGVNIKNTYESPFDNPPNNVIAGVNAVYIHKNLGTPILLYNFAVPISITIDNIAKTIIKAIPNESKICKV